MVVNESPPFGWFSPRKEGEEKKGGGRIASPENQVKYDLKMLRSGNLKVTHRFTTKSA